MFSTRFAMSVEPNVTPMLDVLLVLIVAFLWAIKFSVVIRVPQPEPCVAGCAGTTENIVLEVLPGDRYRINQRDVDVRSLPQTLASIYGSRSTKVLYVAGYPGVRYSSVVREHSEPSAQN